MRVLFLTHRLPYAPNRGDRNRAYHLLREMSKFAEVSVFSLVHDNEEASHLGSVPFAHDTTGIRVPRFRNLLRGVTSLATDRPLTHTLLDAPGIHPALATIVRDRRPDVVVAFCSGMARFALEPPLTRLPLVIDMVDVDSQKWREVAARSRGPWRWLYRREARTLGAFEAAASQAASMTFVVNERELTTLAGLAPDARLQVLQNGIDVDTFRPKQDPATSPVVIFCGVMNYYPNEEGVLWFAEHVWPLIRAGKPDARFIVVGSSPTRSIRKLADTDSSIEVVGHVQSVQPYLYAAAVSVAPVRLARGIQTKVIEALASGLPVVVTPAVSRGLPDEAKAGCLEADDPQEFAKGVLALLRSSPNQRRQKAATARLDGLTWTEQARDLEGILAGAVAGGRRPVFEIQ